MTDTATATNTATKENTMETATDTKANGKGKAKKAKTGNTTLAKLAQLSKGPIRSVQETFRCTPDEHNRLVGEAADAGFTSMSDFYRSKLKLEK